MPEPDLTSVARAFPDHRLTPEERALLGRVARWSVDHAAELVADLTRWVAVPSVAVDAGVPGAPFGPAVAQMLALAARTAEGYGLTVHEHEGYAVSVTVEPGEVEPAREIGLIGHVDVVPAGEGWTSPPFTLSRVGDVAVGRGVADNKGPSLVDLYLLRVLRDLDLPLRHRLRLVLGGSEETGMADLRWYAAHGPVPRVSLVTDGPFGVNHAQKGLLGVTVAVPCGPVLAALVGGDAPNSVPERATAVLPRAAAEVEPVVRAAAAHAGLEAGWVQVDAEPHGGSRVTVHGVAGHAAFPGGTRNPVPLLAAVLAGSGLLGPADQAAAMLVAELLADPDGRSAGISAADATGALTLNGVVLPAAGDSGEPTVLRLRLDVRYPATGRGEEVLGGLAAALARHPAVGASLTDVADDPGYHVDPDSREVTVLQQAFNDVLGTQRRPFAMGGGTHSRVLPRAITFGADYWWLPEGAAAVDGPVRLPGVPVDRGGPHAADESVPLGHLLAALQVYAVAVVRLDAALAAADDAAAEVAR
ncbi:Sapep family Mn(2+)-dependent dipeptidase [Cellulomonas soli]|uniref:Sapep family Mn(2+)-dependent dipeptidase n=1 Tax=Cellulomonas soli TaxID=931535 RepID=UPI003F877ADC